MSEKRRFTGAVDSIRLMFVEYRLIDRNHRTATDLTHTIYRFVGTRVVATGLLSAALHRVSLGFPPPKGSTNLSARRIIERQSSLFFLRYRIRWPGSFITRLSGPSSGPSLGHCRRRAATNTAHDHELGVIRRSLPFVYRPLVRILVPRGTRSEGKIVHANPRTQRGRLPLVFFRLRPGRAPTYLAESSLGTSRRRPDNEQPPAASRRTIPTS